MSTFEKLTASLSFLSCTEGRQFEFVSSGEKDTEIKDVKTVEVTGEDVREREDEEDKERPEGEEKKDAKVEEEEKDERHLKSDEEDSGSDIEILSDLKISTVRI